MSNSGNTHFGRSQRIFIAVALTLVLTFIGSDALAQGVLLRGVSPVNESMGGCATACPIDAAGSLYWNPAAISGMASSDMSFGFGMLLPKSTVTSTAPTGAGIVTGSTESEAGAVPAPSMALVRKTPGSRWTMGLGMFAVGGSRVNYPSDPTNPILAPQGSNPFGLPSFGRLSCEVEILQVNPVVSYQVTDHLAIGFGPTISMGKIVAMPFYLGPPTVAGPPPQFASGVGTRWTWGGGFQLGAYYTTDNDWHFGASFKSPQWCEPFRYNTEDAAGNPQHVEFDVDLPLILSFGTAYSGFDRWTLACDLRWFDYANTTGFGFGRNSLGVAKGLDWNSVMSMGLGAQYQLTDAVSLRMGYIFNENPVDTMAVFGNVGSPLIIKHCLTMGMSYAFDNNWVLSSTYVHAFKESITGPYVDGSHNPIAGTSVTLDAEADTLAFQVSKRF